MNLALRFAIGVLAASSIGYTDPFKPSVKQQIDLGAQAAGDIRKHEKVLPSSNLLSRLVQGIGDRLLTAAKQKDPKMPWHFSFEVIESKEVNAFALPGGSTFVYTGLLSKLKTEDEVAAVMGHEMTHVLRQHWAYAYAQEQKRGLILSGLAMILHANDTLANIGDVVSQVKYGLTYSRTEEDQADEGGLDLMTQAGFDPHAMVDVFKVLKASGGGDGGPEWLSDHPADDRRIKTAEQRIAKLSGPFPAQRPLPPIAPPDKPKR